MERHRETLRAGIQPNAVRGGRSETVRAGIQPNAARGDSSETLRAGIQPNAARGVTTATSIFEYIVFGATENRQLFDGFQVWKGGNNCSA